MADIWASKELLSLAISLTVIIDPIAAAGIFMGFTASLSLASRRAIAIRAHITALLTLIVFAIGGNQILHLFGIGLPAFRIAGGLLLLLVSIEMVTGTRNDRRQQTAERAVSERTQDDDSDTATDIAIFPIGIPLLAGPGAIAAVLLYTAGPYGESIHGIGLLVGMVLAILLLSLAFFLMISRFGSFIGPSMIQVITRLLGILVAALSAQYILDGLSATFFT